MVGGVLYEGTEMCFFGRVGYFAIFRIGHRLHWGTQRKYKEFTNQGLLGIC